MSIGKDWARELEAEEARKGPEAEVTKAARAIASIPKLIETARAKKEPSTAPVYGWLRYEDVAGTDPDRIEKLAAACLLREERALRVDDLVGVARLILVWCEQNDLEAFLQEASAGMHDTEYNVHVRPKRG